MTVHLFKSILITTLTATLAAGASATTLDDAYTRIKSASDRGDIDGLEQVVRELDATSDRDSATLLAASVGDYRIAAVGQRHREREKARVDAAIARGEARLARWTDADADAMPTQIHAEGLALLASTLGMHIGMNAMQGPFLGSKASAALAQALKLAPEDARVQLAQGMQLMYLPPMFGGDRELALRAFERASTLIPVAQSSPVNWGLDDAWLWRGIALRSLKRNADAQAAFRRALEIDPGNGWGAALLAANRTVPIAPPVN